jgi:putative redox protein
MTTARIGKDHYTVQIETASGHALMADEPEDMGGENLGPAPDEWLAASLAACSAITMRMYADRKAWPLEKVHIRVHFERRATDSVFKKSVMFEGLLSQEQKERLLQIGNNCPVHKTLSNPIVIESVIESSS